MRIPPVAAVLPAALLCFAALALPAAGGAEEAAELETWVIDPVHSEVGFRVRHFFAKVPGRFDEWEGTLTFDPKDLTTAGVEVTIQAASIDTGNANRDNHLRNEDFFDAQQYPEIRYVSKGVRKLDQDRYLMEGELTMKGITKAVDLEVESLGIGTGMRGRRMGGFQARGNLDRQDFGVSWNRAMEGGGLALGDTVEIILDIEVAEPRPQRSPSTD